MRGGGAAGGGDLCSRAPTLSRTPPLSPPPPDWTMWKLPMFGCTDGSQVLAEVAACTKVRESRGQGEGGSGRVLSSNCARGP